AARHHQLALVVRVDQADQVAQHDAVLVAQSRAGQDHGGQARVADVHRQAGGDQQGLARLEDGVFLEQGAQVKAGGARGGVLRQGEFVAQARVEDLGLESVHVAYWTWLSRSAMKATNWRAILPLLVCAKRVWCCWRSITVRAFSSLLKPMLGLATSLATIRSRFLSLSLRVA